ncbi:MAG: AAA family ATPase [Betaproteobacteria bacterium]|nr:AAA family ATPase [Betaproteobacteria bacterium]
MIAQELEVSLHMAFVEARQQRHEFITVEHLLLALLDNPSAAEVLRACSAQVDDLRQSLSSFIKDNTPQVAGTEEVDTQPTLGFQRVIQRAIMHVQSTGSGKKEVTGANVLVAIFGEKDSHAVYYLHQQGITRLDVVGTKYRGDFEQRLKGVLKALKDKPHAVLFIDEIHTLIGAGAASGGTLDASNLLKPALSSGQLKCIGATTFTEYRGIFEKDAALSRRFQKVDVVEPTVSETVDILKGLKSRFEEHHSVKYATAALQAAAELSAKFINDRQLPDKAIDVIDEAGAAQRILPSSKRKKTIGKAEIEDIVAKIARIPPANVSNDDRSKLQTIERDLKSVVFGQDKALEVLASAVKMARSGLGKTDKPIGAFLFSGPTGVGKTEAAKQLAYIMGIELIRFDMSEYMERHAVSRLIGAPPGYVGFDQGGLLTEAVTKKPHCVLLLDEIEKAHPDIFNVLLQVMDHGTLTDNNGRKADFRNVIIIMTTNAGAETMNKATIGFTNPRQAGDEMGDIKRLFTPEFRNRLDAMVSFKALDEQIIMRVVDKFLLQLETQLSEKKVDVTFSDKLRKFLAKKGFDPLMGARPMQRLIQDTIRKALADELLFGRLIDGGRLSVDLDDKDEVLLDITPLPKKEGRNSKSEPHEPEEATAS